MRLNVRDHAHLVAVRQPFSMASFVVCALAALLLCTASAGHAQSCTTNGDCNDSISCTTDTCVALSCENTDNCGAGEACNSGTDACQSTAGDPDNDGLADGADPCPFDVRNACFGMVALEPSTARPMRINANTSSVHECAGDKIDCNGDLWVADNYYNDPLRANTCNLGGGGEACVIAGISAIFGCDDENTEDIFQCDHSDTTPAPNLIYDFDVADGTYLVNMFFANTFDGTTLAGERVFDISAEGVLIYDDFDQILAAGGNATAVVRSVVLTVSDGNGLTIEFGRETSAPAVKAFEVLGSNAGTCDTTITCPTHTTCDVASGLCEFDPGFTTELVASGFIKPTSLEFLPDGRVLVLEKRGDIHILDPSTVPATSATFLDLPDVLDTSEAGLIDITLDPAFGSNSQFYLFYAHDSNSKHRISRFTSLGATADAGSEFVVWEDDEAFGNCCHYGGGLDFGPDGKLYMSLGEKYDPPKAQDLTLAAGSIIRVNKNGTIPIDNAANDNTCSISLTACNADIDCPGGETCVLGPNNDSIWAYGFRNPFRAYWDDATSRYFVADLGFNTFETLNLGQAGGNYGWPTCELNCGDPGTYTDPIFHYRHVGGGHGIVGGHVYHGSQFPTGFQDSYFYGDYAAQFIRYLTFDATGTIVTGNYAFHDSPGSVVALEFSPDGALYWLDYAAGELRRVVYNAGNQAPVITSATATPTSGAVTLNVAFSATATDNETDPLSYHWIFGDGAEADGQNVNHDYTTNGVYNAQLIVSDAGHDVASELIEITVGSPPTATITAPASLSTFQAGDMITYMGTSFDPDETLTGANFAWNIELIHDDHSHPRLGPISGTSGMYTAPESGHPYGDKSLLRISLTITDSDGLSDTDTVDVLPELVDLTFDTVPSGMNVLIDGITEATPITFEEAKGYVYTISTLSPQCSADVEQNYASWSDAGSQTHQITVPSTDTTYTATFSAGGVCEATGDPDNDGLTNGSDPCPMDPRNKCFGGVATDQTTLDELRINAYVGAAECGGAKTDCNGDNWVADFGYNVAASADVCDLGGGGEACTITGISTLFGCDDEETEDLFQCGHFDKASAPELIYDFDLPNGNYVVNVFFANTFSGTSLPGERTFDILAEGVLAYDEFDQIAEAGATGRAVVRAIAVTVDDGDGLQIEFQHGAIENPTIKAIEVLVEATAPCATNGDCDDSVFCNGVETCAALVCAPGSEPCPGQMCDEVGDVCADCLVDLDCDDSNGCTIDTCVAGSCSNTADEGAGCDDGEACTLTDLCNASGNCVGTPDTGNGCDDGSLCTTGDTCSAGGLCEGTPIDCTGMDDICNDGACDGGSGSCIQVPKANGTDCSNGEFCDGAETCQTGACSAGADPCMGQACDEVGDQCLPCSTNADCSDSIACTEDLCAAGICSNTDSCPLFQACSALSDVCEVVSGDPDNDGLDDGNDPCPNDPRNLCYGPVAVDQTTATDIRINAHAQTAHCAGPRIDCNGDVWETDFGYNRDNDNSECNLGGGGELCVVSGISSIFGCDSDDTEDLFQCEHFDKGADPELIYDFDVADGNYVINFFFANTFTDTDGVGDRIFDIAVESTLVYDNFDQVDAAGGSGIAVVRSALVNVNDGNGLQIEFIHDSAGDPAFKALEVLEGLPTTTTTTTTTTLPMCLPGDCNQNEAHDPGDALCTVLCTIGQPPAGADCACAADCNCLLGVEASDPICAVLRQIGSFAPDTCDGGGAFVYDNGEVPADSDLGLQLSAPRIGDKGRATYKLRLRGSDASNVAGMQLDLGSDGRIGRVRLAGRLRKRGFSMNISRAENNAAVAFIMPPIEANGVGAMEQGVVVRIRLPQAEQQLAIAELELGSTAGTPIEAPGVTRGVNARAASK